MDEEGNILLAKDDEVTAQIIALCHQGDLRHRSAEDTVAEFRAHYRLHELTRTAEAKFIKHACAKCLGCIKTRTGQKIPRPTWYLVYATTPFEYIHMDFMSMPDTNDGCTQLLVVVDDFSLTVLLQPTNSANAATVAKALIDHWLAVYPDPLLLHTDGGSHFNNTVVKLIARARGWEFTMATPYASWTHGVAERMNRTVRQILRTLCRNLGIPVNKWTKVIKLVQATINRMPRASRGGKSPIELTTSQKPRTAASIVRHGGVQLEVLDANATQSLNVYSAKLAEALQERWQLANTARRAVSAKNRRASSQKPLPQIDIGDYVLYAVHKPDTELDYLWRGSGEVIDRPNSLVYTVRPCTTLPMEPFDVHVQRVRRFASARHLNMTETLQADVDWDHPDNIVERIVAHQTDAHGVIWMDCHWKGFTAEINSLQKGAKLAEDVPKVVLERDE